MGVADYYEEGDYFTSSGNKITYTNWAEGEPDNMVLLRYFIYIPRSITEKLIAY